MKTNDIQAKIEKLQAEQEALNVLMSVYPSDLPEPDLIVWHNSKLSEFGLIFKIKTLDEARGVIGTLWNHPQVQILPLSLSKGTFTTFRTPEHETERGEKSSRPVFPVIVDVNEWEIEFKFYATLEGHLLSITVETEHGSGFQRYASVRFQTTYHTSKTGRETVHTDKSIVILNAPAFQGYERIKWWGSGDHPNEHTLYFPHAESLDDLFAEGF